MEGTTSKNEMKEQSKKREHAEEVQRGLFISINQN